MNATAGTGDIHVKEFQNPPIEHHVGTWWHWMNGHITREGITQDLEAMHRQGIQHVTVLNVCRPFSQEYKNVKHLVAPENMKEVDESHWPSVKFGSKEWLDLFRFAVDEAARLGMFVGAANCDGWSESGGPWITPELSMKEFVWSAATVRGGRALDITMDQPTTRRGFYRDAFVLAYPSENVAGSTTAPLTIDPEQVMDLSAFMDGNGHLLWQAPIGQWKIVRFGYTTTGKVNHPASPEGEGLECDKMDTTALNLHFAHFPQKLIEAAGPHRGKAFRYFLVDSWEAGNQTWTERLPEEFLARRGYSLVPWLPALCGDIVSCPEDVEAFKHDFQSTLSDLILDNYFKHLADLCHRQGMQLYSEGIYGSEKLPAVDVLKSYKYCDVPMTEFWAKLQAHHYPYPTLLQKTLRYVTPQHAAVLYDKPVVGSEAYTGYAIYSDAPFDLKLYGDQAYSEGVSQMILHSYVHQMQDRAPGFTLGVYGQSFNRLNPWFNESRPFMDWQARQQYMLQGAVRVADALIYMGDPCHSYECSQEELDRLLPPGTKYQYINADVLMSDRISVRDGKILLDGDKEYQYLVVRDQAMHLSTLRYLEGLAGQGVAVVGVKPQRTLRLNQRALETDTLRVIADRMWGSASFRPAPVVAADMTFGRRGDRERLLYSHTRKGGKEIYFIANTQDRDSLITTFTPRQSAPEAMLLDPMDGQCYRLSAKNGTTFPLTLRPKQSIFLVTGMSKSEMAQCVDYEPFMRSRIVETLEVNKADGIMLFESDKTLRQRPIGRFGSLTDIGALDLKYYSGVLTYKFNVSVPKSFLAGVKTSAPSSPQSDRIVLQIPAFNCTAHITLNGKDIGILWDPNYELDITSAVRPGKNEFSITITTPWRNRIVGDLNQDRYELSTFTTSPGVDKYDQVPYFSRRHELIPTGMWEGMVLKRRTTH